MSAVVADTHATVWYVLNTPNLSPTARAAMQQAASDGDPVYVPSISLVEVAYLVEKNRLPQDLLARIMTELEDEQSVLTMAPLDLAVARALPAIPRAEVPDMPDRIIAATAVALGLILITRDHRIRTSSVPTIW